MSARNGPNDNQGIDWTRYSSSYDLMVRFNPFYRENIRLALEVLTASEISPGARVCDIGAGTGNYISALSSILPDGHFTHVDADPGMNAVAQEKYAGLELEVEVVTSDIASYSELPNHFDLILCINALYAMPAPRSVLHWVYRSIRPGGHFFVIDFGRKMEVGGWIGELTKAAYAEGGVRGVLQLYSKAPELIRQNSLGSKMQSEGEYWMHSTCEFLEAHEKLGFEVLRSGTCYRGACDYALLRKPE